MDDAYRALLLERFGPLRELERERHKHKERKN